MRTEPNHRLDRFRSLAPPSDRGANWGLFLIEINKTWLKVISSGSDQMFGWEHVSVSANGRTPTWDEMQAIKELFWADEETVLQFHPKRSEYINHHPFVLHLWRKLGVDHELPPQVCV